MSAYTPYTPFFIHPNQKKRMSRKRNNVALQQQEDGYAPVFDARTRRPTSANGNGEWIPIRADGSLAKTSPSILRNSERRTVPPPESSIQTRSKRARNVMEENEQVSHPKVEEESGIHDVAAEVEVNVEDDTGDPDPSDSSAPPAYRPEDGGAGVGPSPRSQQQQQQFAGEQQMVHTHQQQQQQHQPHHQQQQQPPSAPQSKFDPDACTDICELRHRLYASFDRIDHLQHANMCMNRLKQENNILKAEVNKCTYRVSQLESIVLERNLRLKQLLSENVLMSARMKRIQSEFGVDAVKEIFNRV